MATNEHPEREDNITGLVPAGPQDLAPVEISEPEVPKGMTEEETREFQDRARKLIAQLEEASGGRELELIDSLANVGMQSQRNAGSELTLLRSRVGDLLTNEGPTAGLSNDLVELRAVLNQINPSELSNEGFAKKMFRRIPIVGKFNPAVHVLERIAIRYEPVSKQVTMIESRLREGRQMLTRDNVEMRILYEQVEAQQLPIQKNAYLGELLMQQLNELLAKTDDTPSRREGAQRPA